MVELNLLLLFHVGKDDASCISFKEHKGAVLDALLFFLFFFFFGSRRSANLSDVRCCTETMKAHSSLLTGLQDLINNTSLAELEKRLKETPFTPPKVGKNTESKMTTFRLFAMIVY